MGMVAGGDFFSELQDFCRERESASRCAPFEEICCRYEHLYEKYSASYEYLSRGVEDCAATRQCSVGGLSIHPVILTWLTAISSAVLCLKNAPVRPGAALSICLIDSAE